MIVHSYSCIKYIEVLYCIYMYCISVGIMFKIVWYKHDYNHTVWLSGCVQIFCASECAHWSLSALYEFSSEWELWMWNAKVLNRWCLQCFIKFKVASEITGKCENFLVIKSRQIGKKCNLLVVLCLIKTEIVLVLCE